MMNLGSAFLLVVLGTTEFTAEAFAPRLPVFQSRASAPVAALQAHNEKQVEKQSTPASSWQQTVGQTVATAFLTATLWSGGLPSDVTSPYSFFSPPTAIAREMASGSGSRVNKDPESLLRLALPINNKEVRPSNQQE